MPALLHRLYTTECLGGQAGRSGRSLRLARPDDGLRSGWRTSPFSY